MSAPIYKSLDQDKGEIRLLYLTWNGKEDEAITARMITAPFEDCPCYAALSYVWGDETQNVEAVVNGSKVEITRNLAVALRHLRRWKLFRGAVSLPLWADAICINQRDVAERGHQVRLMGLVFSSALYVVSWLGAPTGGQGDINFGAVRRFASLHKGSRGGRLAGQAARKRLTFEQVLRDPSPCMGRYSNIEEYIGAINLAESPYWTRTWIVQELVLASDPDRHLFCYGNDCVTYRQLEDYNDFVDGAPMKCSPTVPLIPLVGYLKEHGRDVPAYVVAGISNRCSSSNPLDAIYGLLGVVELDITPDYEKPVVDLYREWFAGVLAQGDYKDMLSWAGIGHKDYSEADGFPSWLPNLGMRAKRAGFSWEMPIDFVWRPNAVRDAPLAAFPLQLPSIKAGDILSISGARLEAVAEINIYEFQSDLVADKVSSLEQMGVMGIPSTKGERCEASNFFRTEQGNPGSGPEKTLPGDVLCFLDGLSWTALLRRRDESTWAYVGTCRLDTRPDQIYLEKIQRGEILIEEFNLR
ncbi:heterokaryon incompatibility protein-domain-containing protein [Durotheca rogersii]|uniref:heterokaryon incompatibility protein-domain-containing protein n=1 Tax=Durotheca rogersii TaxID=419775 RepID=UPI00221E69A9|nr:heterokaryon incompatibility protein-domain-containing protein [Durotheca rogersii]KAI5857449.1 heterokaryon incompatibility protein-domain-containing protein [Durotheca rogersii]